MVHGEKKDNGHADTSKLAVLGCFFVSQTADLAQKPCLLCGSRGSLSEPWD